MSKTRNNGGRTGEQVPLSVANANAARVSRALREREHVAAEAAMAAVERALKQLDAGFARTPKALRAAAKPKKD